MTDRTVLALTGEDRSQFLQGLITNDVTKAEGGIVYAALLSPQGKYLADFFVIGEPGRLLIDVASSIAPALLQRLTMYKLRAAVQIEQSALIVSRGTGEAPVGAKADPRHPALGWRLYGTEQVGDDTDWDALRTTHLIPETGIDLTPETYILEAQFEALHGVDFKKGCYVGQEVTARMKHKTELKKGLARVSIDGEAKQGDPISAQDKPVGTLHTVSGGQGIAYLRFDRATGPMQSGTARITRLQT